MKRQYLAQYDDGHDYGSFTYWSEHRNKSEANRRDAMLESHKKYGWKRACNMRIISTSLYKYY